MRGHAPTVRLCGGGVRGAGGRLSDNPNAYQLDREPDPSDSLRTFGAFVQAMREHAGYSRIELGALVGYSKYTAESVEYGRRMPDRSFVEGADSATGNTGALKKAAKHLTRSDVGFAAWFRQ
ncbi:helix-turn-helix protein [Streptomyces sp. PsTaAH-130]|nr:helix-turn-helix protein [Streptomyces sp. PsTaAH-130]